MYTFLLGSQFKPVVQLVTGNSEGALQTEINFLKRLPVASQCISMVQVINGDTEGAIETQIEFVKSLGCMVDRVPVVGHTKAAVHYICDDQEGARNAMNASNHTLGVIGGALGGFIVGGPAGATIGGALGGMYADCIINTADIRSRENGRPYGVCNNIRNFIQDPTDGGNVAELIGGAILYGMTGHTAGPWIGEQIQNRLGKRNFAEAFGNEAQKDTIYTGGSIKKNKPHVMTQAKDCVTCKTAMGYNKSAPQVPVPDVPITLQKSVPNAKQVESRLSSNCAERQAYNGIHGAHPEVSPGDLTSVSVCAVGVGIAALKKDYDELQESQSPDPSLGILQ